MSLTLPATAGMLPPTRIACSRPLTRNAALRTPQWNWRLQAATHLHQVEIEGPLVHVLAQAQRSQRVAHYEAHNLPRHLVCALVAPREGRLRLGHAQEAAQQTPNVTSPSSSTLRIVQAGQNA